MVERYIKTVEEHLQKVVASNQRDWDERFPLFLHSRHCGLDYCPPGAVSCDLLFGAPPDKERPTTDHAADLVDHLHDNHD
jgi:hypothetical protein